VLDLGGQVTLAISPSWLLSESPALLGTGGEPRTTRHRLMRPSDLPRAAGLARVAGPRHAQIWSRQSVTRADPSLSLLFEVTKLLIRTFLLGPYESAYWRALHVRSYK